MLTPTNGQNLPLKHLRNSVAASAAFQSLVSAGDAAAAALKVFYHEVSPAGVWASATTWDQNDFVAPVGVDYVFQATTGGTGGNTAPAWSGISAAGQTLTDGNATWTSRARYADTDGSSYAGVLRALRPYAIVQWGENWQASRQAERLYGVQGEVRLILAADCSASYATDPRSRDAFTWWGNTVGAVLEQAAALDPASGDYLDILGFQRVHLGRANWEDDSVEGDWFVADYIVSHTGI